MRLVGLFLLLTVVLSSCDSGRVYEFDQDFKDKTWKISDSTRFEFAIPDAGIKYNVYCNVRNSLDYPWARLFVEYTLLDSINPAIEKKLVGEYLFDQKSGKPFGSSGLGDLYDHQFPLLKNYEFKHSGRYTIRLEEFMRTDTLRGIMSVGVRVEKADSAH